MPERLAEPPFNSGHFAGGDRHALYVGWVLGLAMRHGLPVTLVDDEHGNHTDRLAVIVSPTLTITVVVPPPPDDWTFDAE